MFPFTVRVCPYNSVLNGGGGSRVSDVFYSNTYFICKQHTVVGRCTEKTTKTKRKNIITL